jgi:hypothetical protein
VTLFLRIEERELRVGGLTDWSSDIGIYPMTNPDDGKPLDTVEMIGTH